MLLFIEVLFLKTVDLRVFYKDSYEFITCQTSFDTTCILNIGHGTPIEFGISCCCSYEDF